MDFDTWEEFTLVGGVDSEPEGTKQKPIHKLAARGKTEMVRLILDNCDIDPDDVNTVVPEVSDETPLYYAIQGDHVETMNFLLERGGGLVMESVNPSIHGYGCGRLLGPLFAFAIIGGHLKAAVALYERRWGLANPVFHSGNPGFVHTRRLKEHIKNVAHLTPSISPLQAACRRGNEDILEAILYLLVKVTGVNLPVSVVQSLKHTFTKLLFYIARSGGKEMLDLVIGHGFNIEAAMELKVDEVKQLLDDEDSHENALDKILFNGDTLLENILIASDGHYMTLENVAQWSDNKEFFDYLVDLQLKQEAVSSGNESQATGLGSQSKQLYQEKSASEGEAYAQRILSGFETGSAPEEVISIHYNIDFPHELSVECCKRGYLGILQFLEDCGLNLSPNPQVPWDLHITAVQYGHVNVADFLLRRGFSVNSSDGSSAGWSPLQRACQSPHMDPRKKEMVSFLLKKGADPNWLHINRHC
jgi:ankyrin repeat protein